MVQFCHCFETTVFSMASYGGRSSLYFGSTSSLVRRASCTGRGARSVLAQGAQLRLTGRNLVLNSGKFQKEQIKNGAGEAIVRPLRAKRCLQFHHAVVSG